jgi:hypothetical protein
MELTGCFYKLRRAFKILKMNQISFIFIQTKPNILIPQLKLYIKKSIKKQKDKPYQMSLSFLKNHIPNNSAIQKPVFYLPEALH